MKLKVEWKVWMLLYSYYYKNQAFSLVKFDSLRTRIPMKNEIPGSRGRLAVQESNYSFHDILKLCST